MVGTLYKEMKLKPSILDEYNKARCPPLGVPLPGQPRHWLAALDCWLVLCPATHSHHLSRVQRGSCSMFQSSERRAVSPSLPMCP